MSTIVFVKQIFHLNHLILPQALLELPFWGGSLITYAIVLPTRWNTYSVLDLGFLKYGPNLRSTLELIVQKSQVFPQIIC